MEHLRFLTQTSASTFQDALPTSDKLSTEATIPESTQTTTVYHHPETPVEETTDLLSEDSCTESRTSAESVSPKPCRVDFDHYVQKLHRVLQAQVDEAKRQIYDATNQALNRFDEARREAFSQLDTYRSHSLGDITAATAKLSTLISRAEDDLDKFLEREKVDFQHWLNRRRNGC